MNFSDTLKRFLELRDDLKECDSPLPVRIQMREEYNDLKKQLDDFEVLVYDMYTMVNKHNEDIYYPKV